VHVFNLEAASIVSLFSQGLARGLLVLKG
jgi:hypothetical protein